MYFWPKARRGVGKYKIFRLDSSLSQTKQNTWIQGHMDGQTHTHSQTHPHKMSSFCPLFGFFLSPDYMTLRSVAEHFLEIMSWKDCTRAVKSTGYE